MEHWKPIPNHKQYEVYDLGRIHSLKRTNNITMKQENANGYHRITFSKNGKPKRFLVHRLVLSLFHRPPKLKEQCNHKNGIRNDNKLSNLEWLTASENQLYSYSHLGLKSHGRSPFGEKNHRSKKINLNLVFSLRHQGWSQQKIADQLGLHQTMISHVLKGHHWSKK